MLAAEDKNLPIEEEVFEDALKFRDTQRETVIRSVLSMKADHNLPYPLTYGELATAYDRVMYARHSAQIVPMITFEYDAPQRR